LRASLTLFNSPLSFSDLRELLHWRPSLH
jgi:hypothetical protein